jgi:hypothetical protein
MQINVRTNFPDVAAQLDGLRQDIASQVMARSLNRTMEQAKTAMSKEIRSEFNLSASYVRDRLRIRRAFAKDGQFSLSADLIGGDGKRRSANVIAFGARPGTGGVSVLIKKGQRKVIKGTFIGNKGRTVFRRVGKARLPIEPVRTIDVAQMFNARRINAAVVSAMKQKFPAIFQRELAYALTKAGV